MKARPLRILVLHGRKQSGVEFRAKTRKALQEALRGVAILSYADGPRAVTTTHAVRAGREWWDAVEGADGSWTYHGLEDSLRYLDHLFATQGPFDGVLGFSQGGCLAALLAALQQDGADRLAGSGSPPPGDGRAIEALVPHVRTLQFAVIISAFGIRDGRPGLVSRHLVDGKPRTPPLRLPSFHVWGSADAQVEPARSESLCAAFEGAKHHVHASGHWGAAIKKWPAHAIAAWLKTFQQKDAAAAVAPPVLARMPSARSAMLSPPLPTFAEKLKATQRASADLFRAAGDLEIVLRPVGLHHVDLLDTPFWRKASVSAPIIKPRDLTPADADAFAEQALSRYSPATNKKAQGLLADDMMLLAWCLYPWKHTLPLPPIGASGIASHSVRERRALRDGAAQAFSWLWWAVCVRAPEHALGLHLPALLEHGNWFDLVRIALYAHTGSCIADPKPARAAAAEKRTAASPAATQFQERVAEVMARQLYDDSQRAAALLLPEGDSVSEAESAELPSGLADEAPRFHSAIEAATGLARDISVRLEALERQATRTSKACSGPGAGGIGLSAAARTYRRALAAITRVRHAPERHARAALTARQARWSAMLKEGAGLEADEAALAARVAAPLSDAVANPEPEPVEVSPPALLSPLHEFLRHHEEPPACDACVRALPDTLPDGNLTFPRGTLCADGRLDLCKQVIGPQGIDDLIASLRADSQSTTPLVQHLLLGNNIAGDALGARIASLIENGESKLTTWYIAGNRLTAAGLAPLCTALSADSLVRQLWLKRNPIRAVGAMELGRLLRANSTITALDLVCTGLLDEGVEIICAALSSGAVLKHLYLDGNGIRPRGCAAVAKVLSGPSALEGVGLGCNRVGSEGAALLAKALVPNGGTLGKLGLASCGIGQAGAEALATAITDGAKLRWLDLGFLKMTQALGEVPNAIGDAGARALTNALRTNKHLVALDLNFNGVSHATHEQIRVRLRRNFRELDVPGKEAAHAVLFPPHLAEVLSVYRLGGEYKGDAAANALVWEEAEGDEGEGKAVPPAVSRSESDL